MNAIFINVVGDTMGSVNDITKIDTDHAGDTEEEVTREELIYFNLDLEMVTGHPSPKCLVGLESSEH